MAADFIIRYLIEGSTEPIQVQSLADLDNLPAKVSWVEIPFPGRRARINGDCIAALSWPEKKLIRIEIKPLPDLATLPGPQFSLVYVKQYSAPHKWMVEWKNWIVKLRANKWVDDGHDPSVGDSYKKLRDWFNPMTWAPITSGEIPTYSMLKEMPWEELKVLNENSGPRRDVLQAGLFSIPSSDNDEADSLHVLLYSATTHGGSHDTVSRSINLSVVKQSSMQSAEIDPIWTLAPGIFAYPLGSVSGNNKTLASSTSWLTFVSCYGRAVTGVAPEGLAGLDFLRLWNRAVFQTLSASRVMSGGTPLVALPIFQSTSGSPNLRSNILFESDGSGRVRHIFLTGNSKENLSGNQNEDVLDVIIDAKFSWQSDSTVLNWAGRAEKDPDATPPAALISQILKLEEGSINTGNNNTDDNNSDNAVIDLKWPENATTTNAFFSEPEKPIPNNTESVFQQLYNKLNRLNSGKAAPLTRFTIKFANCDTNPIRIGSFIITPKDSKPTLTCELTGNWDSSCCDLYPYFELKDLKCRVEMSGGSDTQGRNVNSQFDTASRAEDDLQRESSAIMDPRQLISDSATLKIRFRAEPGRNALLQMDLDADSLSVADSKSYFFNARPYLEAQLDFIKIDAEAGKRIARWRSDDPDGPQWRLGYSELTFRLPAQAVGEEMERGNRFWEDLNTPNTSYINRNVPIKYRFSPATSITVRPGIKDRRYNKSFANLREIVRDADVEKFTTEIIYPLQIKFERDANREPEVRLTEAGEFFGLPAENLPVLPATESFVNYDQTVDLVDKAFTRWLKDVDKDKGGYSSSYYRTLRAAQSAVRVNFVSRLAILHLYDPYRKDHTLHLTRGLGFTLRDTKKGAPPLTSPLPTGIDLGDSQKIEIKGFLDKLNWGSDSSGAIRAGLIHTIEFSSELISVLRNPVSKQGIIETLSFSALGATGTVSASFDEGRTAFTADVRFGQASRIVKTRTGRVGVHWNKAKHVIIYERTTVPSLQFAGEQDEALNGWPILRKTEEYVELIEAERRFDAEQSTKENRAGAVYSSRFISKRIYVNGAWGRDVLQGDVLHGYEIPLWSKEDTSGFYPKPYAALLTFAKDDEKTRQRLDEPESLVFYSNTELGEGAETDRWLAKVLVDFPAGWRGRVVAGSNGTTAGENEKDRAERTLAAGSIPNPSANVPRNPRFDFAVTSEGAANIQHTRGDTPMLVSLNVISMARTSQVGSSISDEDNASFPKEILQLKEFGKLADASMTVRSIEEEFGKFYNRLDPIKYGVYAMSCADLKDKLKKEASLFFSDLRKRVESVKGQFAPTNGDEIEAHVKSLLGVFEERVRLPVPLVDALVKDWGLEVERLNSLYLKFKNDAWSTNKAKLIIQINNWQAAIGAYLGKVDSDTANTVSRLESTAKSYLDSAVTLIDKLKSGIPEQYGLGEISLGKVS